MDLCCPICGTISTCEHSLQDANLYRCPDCDHCFSDISSIKEPEKYMAEYYEVNHRNWFRNPNISLFEAIYSIINKLKPDTSSVIDIGCGNGYFLKYLHKKNPLLSLTGIDLVPNNPVEGIDFIQGDILTTEFVKRYDVIVSLAVIEHIDNIQILIKRVYELCASGGLVIIMTLNDRSVLYGTARMLYRLGYKAPFERLYSKHHLNHFNISSLKRLVEPNGLLVVKLIRHNAPLDAIDFTASSLLTSSLLRVGVGGTFLLGRLTGGTYLQTIVCEKVNLNQQN